MDVSDRELLDALRALFDLVAVVGPHKALNWIQEDVDEYGRGWVAAWASRGAYMRELAERLARPVQGKTIRYDTAQRFLLYASIKEAHPLWSKLRVAMRAQEVEPDYPHSEDSVENAYRAVGAEWTDSRPGGQD